VAMVTCFARVTATSSTVPDWHFTEPGAGLCATTRSRVAALDLSVGAPPGVAGDRQGSICVAEVREAAIADPETWREGDRNLTRKPLQFPGTELDALRSRPESLLSRLRK
jgi:hypothetical protein